MSLHTQYAGLRHSLSFTGLALVGGLAASLGCGSTADSQVHDRGGPASAAGAGGTGGSGNGGAAGASTAGNGGASAGTSGSGGTGGANAAGVGGSTAGVGGSSGTAGNGNADGSSAGNACSAHDTEIRAVHVTMDVSWMGSLATNAGTGKVEIWLLSTLNANNGVLTGQSQSCGTSLPEIDLNLVGQGAAGGSKILIEIPNSVWDAPSMPKFPTNGMQSSFDVGSTVDIAPTVGLLGLTAGSFDASTMWPTSYQSILTDQLSDDDGDGVLGIHAVPRDDGTFVPPPTGLGAPAADAVSIVSRNVLALHGTRSTCDDVSGTADVTAFDNHVVACHVKGGSDCTADQIKFIDDSRTVYTVTGGSGTFVSKRLADGAGCADVRSALP